MNWKQITDPFNNLTISALVAVVPIVFIFWALIVKKMKGYKASILATVIAILIAIFVYGMPVKLSLLSTANGAL
jgi:lactate permease